MHFYETDLKNECTLMRALIVLSISAFLLVGVINRSNVMCRFEDDLKSSTGYGCFIDLNIDMEHCKQILILHWSQ